MTATNKFAGTWRLLACEGRWSDGCLTHPYGHRPDGLLIYDSHGNFSGQIMAQERPQFARNNLLKGADTEVRAAFEGYIAYYGRYEVDESQKLMIHTVEGSLFPNWIGQQQIRQYEFPDGPAGARLQLSTLPIQGARADLTVVLMWQRAT